MKRKLTGRFLLHTIIFTAVYVAFILLMDYVFNGVIVDHLAAHLPRELLYLFYPNAYIPVSAIYVAGIVLIGLFNVLRADRLLRRANDAIDSENDEEKFPLEIAELGNKLKTFKKEVKLNEQARRFAEQQKNDLIVYLAHDLKTPLTSVIGYLSLLSEAPELPAEHRAKYVGIALDKAYRLEQLINEFFDITRLNLQSVPLQKTEFDLSVLLRQIVSEFYPSLKSKNMTANGNISPGIRMYGDPDKLVRVFDNLLRNAVNYGYPHTEIEITAVSNNSSVMVRIRNRSDEIPKEKLEHIFEKFVRLDSARHSETGGAGLGLAIAKQIVELHNGSISVTSENGHTDFTVTLRKT